MFVRPKGDTRILEVKNKTKILFVCFFVAQKALVQPKLVLTTADKYIPFLKN